MSCQAWRLIWVEDFTWSVSGWWWKVYCSWVCDLDPWTAWWKLNNSCRAVGMVSCNCFVGTEVGGQRSQPSKPNHRVEGHRSSHGRFFRCPGQWDAWIPKDTRKGRERDIQFVSIICIYQIIFIYIFILLYVYDKCYVPETYTVAISQFGGHMDEVLDSKKEKQHTISTKA